MWDALYQSSIKLPQQIFSLVKINLYTVWYMYTDMDSIHKTCSIGSM